MVFPLSGPPDTLASTLPSGVSVLRSAATHSEGLSTSFKPSQQGRSGKTGTPAESIVAFAVLEHGESKDTVRESATVGVPTAVVRSMLLQGLQFWYRVPIKVCGQYQKHALTWKRSGTLNVVQRRQMLFFLTALPPHARRLSGHGESSDPWPDSYTLRSPRLCPTRQ